jgi:hypothetical protein
MTATKRQYARDGQDLGKGLGNFGWRRSSYSGSQGNCIEAVPLAGLSWRKSLHSGNEGNWVETATVDPVSWRKTRHSGSDSNCVEVAGRLPGAVAVRDSKDLEGARLLFPAAAWQEFTRTLKAQAPAQP